MTAHTQDVFDPTAYPRTYGLSVASKWMVSILGLVLVSLGSSGAIYFLILDDGRAPAGWAILVALCGGFALLGIYLLAAAVFYRVILQADSIQVFEIYRRRDLARGEIEGRSHFANAQGPSGWVMVPKAGFGGKIKLSMFLKTDKDFLAWIHSLPDLDLGKKRAAEQEKTEAIAALKQRGFSQLTIQRLRRAASGLNWVVYGLGLASFFMRDPDHVLTWALVALPWVAILLVAHFAPYYRFGGPRNSPLPDLSLLLIIPGLFLTLRALQGIAPVGWEGPLLLTVFGSAILVGLAFWCGPWLKKHPGTTVLLLILCCGYGYGAGIQANALLDQSTPKTYRVIITGKNVSHGKSTSYHLKLAQWGPNVNGQDLMVSYSQYAAAKPGDTVCMLLRSGALRVAWSELGRCEGAF
jgi:hypothetical protein